MNILKRELEDYKLLLRNVPSLIVTLFVVSVVGMNLLANKELISLKYLALDCGFVLSWVSFLCMDIICKHFGAKAAVKISVLALGINVGMCIIFYLVTRTPGMWGEYYSTGMPEVNAALNATVGGTWYVVFGSSVAMFVSAVCNSLVNHALGKVYKGNDFRSFALRSYISTFIAQFVDNLVFAVIVSYVFFGWSPVQVLVCSITGGVMELLCEVVFSPVGYRVVKKWKGEKVGEQYINYLSGKQV